MSIQWISFFDIHVDCDDKNAWLTAAVVNSALTLSCLMGAGNWPLILKLGTISTFEQVGFSIFFLVFVSRDFELGRNVSEESTVSPAQG